MDFLTFIIVLAVLLILAVWLYIARQGDAEFRFLTEQRTEFVLVGADREKAVFACTIPFINKGSQDGTIMDAYTRHFLPHEQYDGVEVVSRLSLESDPRTDAYWEALIVPKGTGQAVTVTLILKAKNGDIDQTLPEMVDMSLDIVYQVVARSEWYITKGPRLGVDAADLLKAYCAGAAAQAEK
ncbi:putative membrane protein [Propionispora sp. 2/2-37]|uniref:hypothetical protein n=1 Tax=Propionispora sp. 2/2-37 TaxID=1677858 RepID=UPI0006BB8693|nr:hypothetical protein [Propionispora sp. 2/2-37]CUH97634.1 putative membrane protein [Propionispora sp. 2/2-37]